MHSSCGQLMSILDYLSDFYDSVFSNNAVDLFGAVIIVSLLVREMAFPL